MKNDYILRFSEKWTFFTSNVKVEMKSHCTVLQSFKNIDNTAVIKAGISQLKKITKYKQTKTIWI